MCVPAGRGHTEGWRFGGEVYTIGFHKTRASLLICSHVIVGLAEGAALQVLLKCLPMCKFLHHCCGRCFLPGSVAHCCQVPLRLRLSSGCPGAYALLSMALVLACSEQRHVRFALQSGPSMIWLAAECALRRQRKRGRLCMAPRLPGFLKLTPSTLLWRKPGLQQSRQFCTLHSCG